MVIFYRNEHLTSSVPVGIGFGYEMIFCIRNKLYRSWMG